MFSVANFLKHLTEYNKILNIAKIGRRYFVLNAFDGVLTSLGILIGTFLANVENATIVVSATVGAAIALSFSGVWGAYLTENAERGKELKELERILYTKLKKTKLGRATRAASIILALVNGVAPFTAVLVIISPFFFAGSFAGINDVYYTSFSIAFLILASLGAFLGRISKENIFNSAAKMVLVGIACVIVITLVGKFF